MILIVEKETDILLDMDSEIDYMDNGYPRLINKDTAYVKDDVHVYEILEIPEFVETDKYCYTETAGFYLNPDYEEPNPYGIPDELVEQIKNDAIAQVQEGVLND